jgi:di/tricarboxylate transporter
VGTQSPGYGLESWTASAPPAGGINQEEHPMSDRTLRYLTATVIAMLFIHQVGGMVVHVFGTLWGVISAIAVAAVSVVVVRMASPGARYSMVLLLLVMAFFAVPLVVTVWGTLTEEATWIDRLIRLTPFILGFAAPIVLLLLVYLELRKRNTGSEAAVHWK